MKRLLFPGIYQIKAIKKLKNWQITDVIVAYNIQLTDITVKPYAQ